MMVRKINSYWLRILVFAALSYVYGGAYAAERSSKELPPDLHGVWWPKELHKELQPVSGEAIPFTAEGRQLYENSVAAAKVEAAVAASRDTVAQCLPLGPTRILEQPYPFQVVQKGDLFILIYEHNHVYELMKIGDEQMPNPDPAFMGTSVAKWTKEGIEIVTTNFKVATLLDDNGLPHSSQLSIKRNIHRTAGSKTMDITTIITDPVMFTKPWSIHRYFALRPDELVEEYTCGQGPTLETRYSR